MELGDRRLRDRLIKIVSDRVERPEASYLEASGGDRAATKAYYAFIDSSRPTLAPEALVAATHRMRTIERMMAQKIVLVVQDATDLSFASRHHTQGLGVIGTNQTGAESLGLKLHSSLALTTDGIPLGVLNSVAYAPEKGDKSSKGATSRPIEEKSSFRWIEGYRDCVSIAKELPNTRLLTVADREADMFELFLDAQATRNRVGVLVRAKNNRRLASEQRKLFDSLRESEQHIRVAVTIPRQRWKKAKSGKTEQESAAERSATLTINFRAVDIVSTRKDLPSRGPIPLWGIWAREENPPPDAKRIEWWLLTTEPIHTPDHAANIVDLYTRRWRIEEWHRVLKSGCKAQDHQHETAERLKGPSRSIPCSPGAFS